MTTFLLCLKIFGARIIDVSLGTIRTVYTVKDKHIIASIIGFFEVTVWFLVVQEALNTSNNSFSIAFSYAIGFAVGTYIGGILANKMITNKIGVQVITKKNDKIIEEIRKCGFAVSVINVVGRDEKYLLYLQIDSKKYNYLISIIHKIDNKAFIVVNETKMVKNGYFGIVK